MKTKRAAIYCRVDSGGTPEMQQQALNLQTEKLERYASSHGLQIVGHYQDAGYPGHDMSRPGLAQLVRDCEAGVFEQVLVVNRSRLYRGAREEEPKWPFPVFSMNQLEQNMER